MSIYDDYTTKNLSIWQTPEIIPIFIIYFAIAFTIPILLSFMFTRNHPEKRLVPPFHIQLISFGLLLFFVYNKTTTDWQMLYGLGIYMMLSVFLQDGIVIYALGKSVSADYLIKRSLKVHSNIDRVKDIILSKQFQELNSMRLIDKSCKDSIKLRTNTKRGFILVL